MSDSGIQDEIRALMGLRGFATIAVVSVHLLPTLILLHPAAKGLTLELSGLMICVELFYVMSGFLLTRNYLAMLSRPSWAGTRRFLVLRVARVWPLHVTMLAAILVYDRVIRALIGYGVEGDLGVRNVLANVFLVHEIAPNTVINLPSWSLSPEAGAYVAFPLLALVLLRLRSQWVRLGLLTVILVGGASVLWVRYQGMQMYEWSHTQAWLRMAVTFSSGCIIALVWRDLPDHVRTSRHWDRIALFAGVAAVAGCIGMNLGTTFHPTVPLYPLLVLLILAASCATGGFAKVVGGRYLHWFGKISYGIYLSHFLVLIASYALLARLQADQWGRPGRGLALLGVIVLLVVTGWLAHVLVEEPARKAIRRYAGPRPTPRPVRDTTDSLTA